jgi:hypothetical protein
MDNLVAIRENPTPLNWNHVIDALYVIHEATDHIDPQAAAHAATEFATLDGEDRLGRLALLRDAADGLDRLCHAFAAFDVVAREASCL